MDAAALRAGGARSTKRRAPSDARLVAAAVDGSTVAVEALFERHWDAAYRAAYWIANDPAAAEDIAQEAFLSVLGALGRFDRRRPFVPWLRRATVNRAIDHARACAARREVGIDAVAELAAAAAEPADPELRDALAGLPLEQRAVVVLRHVIGCTPTEIAAVLDLPRGTVNSRLRRGLDVMEARLGGR